MPDAKKSNVLPPSSMRMPAEPLSFAGSYGTFRVADLYQKYAATNAAAADAKFNVVTAVAMNANELPLVA